MLPGLKCILWAALMCGYFVRTRPLRVLALATVTQMRAKLLLLLSYLVSLGAIAGAVTLLVQAQQHGKDMWVGAVSTRGMGGGWGACA